MTTSSPGCFSRQSKGERLGDEVVLPRARLGTVETKMATRDKKRSILTIDLTQKIVECEQFIYIVSRICLLDLEPDLMNV